MHKNLILILLLPALFSCRNLKTDWISENSQYRPPPGYRYLFAGRDPESIGGLEDYGEGYVDFIGMPSGISLNIKISELITIESEQELNEQQYMDNSAFRNVMLALGLDMTGELKKIIAGDYDWMIIHLGEWIRKSGRPVFLKIGYEFDSAENDYNPSDYRTAFIRITEILRENTVFNFRTLWQSSGRDEVRDQLLNWYPGDEYVDWLGYSYYDQDPDDAGKEILLLAAERGLPVFIADAAPRGSDTKMDDPEELWEGWYKPFFKHIADHADLIQAVSYNNSFTTEQEDHRLQAAPLIRERWRREMKTPGWIHRTMSEDNKEFFPRSRNE